MSPLRFSFSGNGTTVVNLWAAQVSNGTPLQYSCLENPMDPKDREYLPGKIGNLRVREILAPRLITEWDQIGTLSLLGCSEGPILPDIHRLVYHA